MNVGGRNLDPKKMRQQVEKQFSDMKKELKNCLNEASAMLVSVDKDFRNYKDFPSAVVNLAQVLLNINLQKEQTLAQINALVKMAEAQKRAGIQRPCSAPCSGKCDKQPPK